MGQNLDSMNQQRSKAELLYDVVVATGNVEAVKALFREGASLEWIDREGKNPLMVACMDRNMIDVAATLIQLGANVNRHEAMQGRDAGTPLHHAAKEGLVEAVKLLLSNGANALVRNDGFQTPLDVARQNRHTDVVRAIESHICYFSGWVRKIPGFLERLFSIKIWVVVTPHGPKDPANPLKLELAAYYTLKDAQPFMFVYLWMTRIEEPNLSESNPKLAIFDNSTKYRHRLAAAVQGDKEQLQLLYNACRGISQVVPSPISQNAQSSVEGAELATASSDSSAAPNSHTIPEASNTNGWGTSAKDDSYNRSGSALGTACSEPNSTGWMDEQVKEDTNDHEPKPHGDRTKRSQTCGESTPSVSKKDNVSASVSSSPSPPLIPEEILDEGLIRYPAIDLSWDALSQPTNNETSAYNHKKLGGDSSSCVICWEAPIEGACVPCGHMAGCMSCLNEIKAKKCVCPVCRSKMNEVVRIYAV